MRKFWKANHRIGASYNLYDGEELLPSSVRSIRPQVDFINVVYQDVSNFGERGPCPLEPFLRGLQEKGLIDRYIRYEPDLDLKAGENEHRKRVIGLNACREAGCGYYLDMDVDEYYRPVEFERARDFVFRHGIDVSAVTIFAYIKSPCYRVSTDCYVPFLIRMPHRECTYPARRVFPVAVDPTRILRTEGRFYLFENKTFAMHHMSWVRYDLERKFRNSSLNANPDNGRLMEKLRKLADWRFGVHPLPEGCDIFNGGIIRKVEDEFGVQGDLDSWADDADGRKTQ